MSELKCYLCECDIEEGEEQEINGHTVCESCYESNYVCEHCGDITEDGRWIEDEFFCDDCINRFFIECDHCGEYVKKSYANSDNYNSYCDDCYEDYYTRCEDCEEIISLDDAIEIDDCYYCESCSENHNEENKIIHDYYYKPDPEFFGNTNNNKFFGIELEIDGEGENDNNAEQIIDCMPSNLIYCKHDGSLDDGFEIVSHPMSYDYFVDNSDNFKNMLDKAISMGYKSHDAGTCGLHIHVSKRFFENDYNELKVLYFFEKFWNNILTFSRRTESQASKWASNYCSNKEEIEDTEELLKKAKRSGRYFAVNLENSNTVEFRIFRGTLNYNTFIAIVQFVNHLTDFTKNISLEDLQKLTWDKFTATINSEEYPELVNYLLSKQLLNS